MASPHNLSTVEDYIKVFTDVNFWESYIREICARHGLECNQVRAGDPGTNIVFLVDDRYVVKIYSQFFDGQAGYDKERQIYAQLDQLLYSGDLFPGQWHYPYFITKFIPGVSLRDVLDDALAQDGENIAAYLGRYVKDLHTLTMPDIAFDNWQTFIQQQKQKCVSNHREWGILPEYLINQIDDYLAQGSLDCTPVFIHADLNADHVLGHLTDGMWHTNGIIDFGDAKIGDPIYEFVALHLGALKSDRRLLKICLDAYGNIPDDFLWRAMAMTLLHEFNVLVEVEYAADMPDLETFAAKLWGT